MARLKLTDTERLILANQYEILAVLKNDESHERLSNELLSGHEWLYSQSFDHVSENLSNSDAEHVVTILGIFGDLRDSYEKFTDKSGIEAREVNFPGFDGNNESDLYSFARALWKHERFTNVLTEHAVNSHMPTTDMYQRMIAKWAELGKPHYPYSKEQMVAILGARAYPR